MSKFLNIIRHDCGERFDANETAAFSRELEYVHAEVIEAKYPELKFRGIIPIKTGAPLGATSHRYFEVDGFGSAKFLDNLATEDFPTAEVKGAEVTGKIRSFGAKWMMTVEELRAAALMRIKPDTEKAKNTKRAMETLLDQTVIGTRTGTKGGFKGLLHDDNSTVYSGTPTNWFDAVLGAQSKAPKDIVDDVRAIIDQAYLATKTAFSAFDLFLPPELDVLLDSPMYFAQGSDKQFLNMSIRQYLLQNVARLRSISGDNYRFANAGASSKHRALCYPRDPEVLDAFIPLEFEQFAPEYSGMAFVTHCHGKYGGLRIKHVKAVMRADFATAAT